MINIETCNHKKASNYFYTNIYTDVENRLKNNRGTLSKLKTNTGKTLYTYLKNNLDTILIGEMNDLKKVIKDCSNLKFKRCPKTSKLGKAKAKLGHVFFYNNYDKWNAYNTLKKLNLHCCPYCNRNYITPIGSDDRKFFRGDFDHFLPKSEYPYLQLSFYNLIPSCIICNQRAKGQQSIDPEKLIYPYNEGFGDGAKFKYKVKDYEGLINGRGAKIKLSVNESHPLFDKIVASKKLFRLDKQYSVHTRELKHLLDIAGAFSLDYLDSLSNTYPDKFLNKEEAYEIVFGKTLNQDKIRNQPLAKFYKDIADEIGLI